MNLPVNSTLQGGKYKIIRFINAGGFGCTYEGLHVLLKKRVAIKEFFVKDFCNRDVSTASVTIGITAKTALVEKLKTKFIEEAQAVNTLKHSHIVNVYDVFEENGTAYYVMDYIDGLSLNDIVKRNGTLSEQKAMKYILQVADALKYIHSRNRLHLDIKPGNIMIDEDDNAILIDFGTSKQYDEVDGENTSTIIGHTPGFAPSEQIGNDIVKFYPSTDIYALGATFYKLLTGITPPNANLLASGEELAPLPSSVSENTCNVVFKAMQVNKTKRPQCIDEFLEILNMAAEDDENEDDKTKVESGKEKNVERKTLLHGVSKKKLITAVCAYLLFVAGIASIVQYNYSTSNTPPQSDVVQPDNALTMENSEELEDVLSNRTEHVTGQTYKDVSGKDYTYTGEVKDGKPNGQGMGIYPYGNYTGEYKDGLRQGSGKFESKDGSNKYEGTFANDKYDTGKLTMSDGYYFDGKFKDGQPYNGSWYDKTGKLDSKVVNGK